MDSLDVITLSLALVAFFFGIFTFWWTSVRTIESLILANIARPESGMDIEFALVNGGTKDLLITNLRCEFRGADKDTRSTIKHNFQVLSGDSLLLPAGRSTHYRVSIEGDFTKDFILRGNPTYGGSERTAYEHEISISVDWITPKGKLLKRSVPISKYLFYEDGHLFGKISIGNSHELFSS